MAKIGAITIGESPRDDILSGMRPYLTHDVEILQHGALDGLDHTAVTALRPEAGQPVLVTRMRDGTPVQVTHEKILPLLQHGVDELVRAGVDFVVSLCTSDFPGLRSQRLLLYPHKLLHSLITAIASGSRLGIVLPSPDQVPALSEGRDARWAGWDLVVTAASPYAVREALVSEWTRAAQALKREGVDLVCLDCMGMDETMKGIVQRVTERPVILARSVVARVVDELIAPPS
jgi:protein AroM